MGTAFVFVLLMDPHSGPAQTYANTLGIVSAIVPVFVWTPQLYTTYKLKGPGSLSLTMQVIQTPGSFIQAFFQVERVSAFNPPACLLLTLRSPLSLSCL
jgi:uncharacterized protein with PQ loop repeat